MLPSSCSSGAEWRCTARDSHWPCLLAARCSTWRRAGRMLGGHPMREQHFGQARDAAPQPDVGNACTDSPSCPPSAATRNCRNHQYAFATTTDDAVISNQHGEWGRHTMDYDATASSRRPSHGTATATTATHRVPSSSSLSGSHDRKDKSALMQTRQFPRRPSRQLLSDEEARLLQSLDGADSAADWINDALEERLQLGSSSTSASQGDVNASHKGAGINGSSPARARRKQLLALDSQLANLSTTLGMAQKDTIASMNAVMTETSEEIPRLGLELRLMAEAARTLKSKIRELQATIQDAGLVGNVETKQNSDGAGTANEVLERLSALSVLHTRMTAARDVLSLAESWSTLSSDVSAFLVDGKFDAAAVRLAQARTSLSVFERTPEYEKRKGLLEDLGNSLEAKMEPAVERALDERNLNELQRSAHILDQIERKASFASIWRKTQIRAFASEWAASTVEEGDRALAENRLPVIDLFRETLTQLVDVLHSQQNFAPAIFDSPAQEMELLVSAAVSSLKPGIGDRLAHIVPHHEHEAILRLVEAHKVFCAADISIANTISALSAEKTVSLDKAPAAASVDTTESLPRAFPISREDSAAQSKISSLSHRRSSSRRQGSFSMQRESSSISMLLPESGEQRFTNSPSHVDADSQDQSSRSRLLALLDSIDEPAEWQRLIFEPFVELQLSYEALERAQMTVAFESKAPFEKLRSLPSSTSGGPQLGKGLSQSLRDATKLAAKLSRAASRRSRAFTYGLGYEALVKCIDETFETMLFQIKTTSEEYTQRIMADTAREAKKRMESGQMLTGEAYAMNGQSNVGQMDEWKAYEDGIIFLGALHDVAKELDRLETDIADDLRDLTALLVEKSTLGSEALARLCKEGDGTSTASFRLLLESSASKLQSGPLMDIIERLQHFSSTASQSHINRPMLLTGARIALLSQMQSLQRYLASLTLSSQLPMLEAYATLQVWEASRLPGAVNEYDLAMPSFSLSPTEEMSQIGETLLDLPRLLEVWVNNADMQWAVEALPYVATQDTHNDAVMRRDKASHLNSGTESSSQAANVEASPSPTREKRMSMQVSAGPTTPMERRVSSNATHRHAASISQIATIPANGSTSPPALDLSLADTKQSSSALQSYLSSICLTLVAHIVSLVLPSIVELSAAGASQLAADLDYLLTILTALNVADQSTAQSPNAADDAVRDQAVPDSQEPSGITNDGLMLLRSLEAWRDVCKLKDADGRRLRHLVRTGQASRGASLASSGPDTGSATKHSSSEQQGDDAIVEGFDGSEDKLRSLLTTEAFDMISRLRKW